MIRVRAPQYLSLRLDTGSSLVGWVGYGFNIILVRLRVGFGLRFVGLG